VCVEEVPICREGLSLTDLKMRKKRTSLQKHFDAAKPNQRDKKVKEGEGGLRASKGSEEIVRKVQSKEARGIAENDIPQTASPARISRQNPRIAKKGRGG